MGDQTALSYFYINRLILCYLFGQNEQAVNAATLTKSYLGAASGLYVLPVFYTFDSLAHLAVCPHLSDGEQQRIHQRVNKNQEQLKQWADHAPANHLNKYYLAEAERYRVLGRKAEAIVLYDHAIAEARESGFMHEEALANELAAKVYLGWGKERIAQEYLIEAYYGYARWGAKAKVNDLEFRYQQLLAPILRSPEPTLEVNDTIPAADDKASSHVSTDRPPTFSSSCALTLDLATVLKASQALSSEIQLEKLLEKLLHVVSENAGADKCVLLLLNEGKLVIEAISQTEYPTQLQSIPLEESEDVPVTLINTVKRTLQASVIIHATAHPTLVNDRYTLQKQTKSLLCLPILHQGKLLGVLYLENNLTTGAFASDRVDLLNLICAQAAISLENAHLYQQTQQALEASKLKQLSIDRASVPVWWVESDGKILYVNDATVGTWVTRGKNWLVVMWWTLTLILPMRHGRLTGRRCVNGVPSRLRHVIITKMGQSTRLKLPSTTLPSMIRNTTVRLLSTLAIANVQKTPFGLLKPSCARNLTS